MLLDTLFLVILLFEAHGKENEQQEFEVNVDNKPFVVRLVMNDHVVETR